MSELILITGATGSVASFVVPQLAAMGRHLRVMGHSREKLAGLEAQRLEVSIGDYDDVDSLREAAKGVGTAFLVTPAHPRAAEWASNFIRAAQAEGVERIVRLSALQADADGPTDNTRQHARTEQALAESGIAYCALRPHFYMQNLLMSLPTLQVEAAMYWGMGDGKLGMIDVRDVADVAARALTDPELDGGAYELTGPESISFGDAAKVLMEVLDREVTYVAVSPDAVESTLKDAGMGDWFATLMRDYSRAYAKGWGDYTTDEVERLAGHEARSFRDFAAEFLAPAFELNLERGGH